MLNKNWLGSEWLHSYKGEQPCNKLVASRCFKNGWYPWLGIVYRKFKFSAGEGCVWDEVLSGHWAPFLCVCTMIILLLFQYVMIPKCAARSQFKFTITKPELALSTAWQFYNLYSLKWLPHLVIFPLRIVLYFPTSPPKHVFIWWPCLILHWEVEAIRRAFYHSPSHQPASVGTCTLPSLCSDEVPLNLTMSASHILALKLVSTNLVFLIEDFNYVHLAKLVVLTRFLTDLSIPFFFILKIFFIFIQFCMVTFVHLQLLQNTDFFVF